MAASKQQITEEWNRYSHFFKREEIAPRVTLLAEGKVARNAYFIEKGCIRLCFNNNGKDITFQFFFEGQGISSIESFKSNRPSLFSMETVEACVVQTISKKNFRDILEKSPLIKKQIDDAIFDRLIYYQKLFLTRIKDNPVMRYHDLLQQHPEIVRRVPQHFIASYLGITPVSLSRIRNRR